MPLIVDKEKMRLNILMAFQRCIEKKPIDKVTLRDIARESGVSHPTLLNYFDSKDDLILSYVKYTRKYMTEHCIAWFNSHPRSNYLSNKDYLNAFMKYVAEGQEGEFRPNATTQTYVLGHYNDEIGAYVTSEFQEWQEVMKKCLVSIYGPTVGEKEAEAMMILISGTFICNYNRALTGNINDTILDYLGNLARE